MKGKQHFVALDGLRGVAALCVLLMHLSSHLRLPLYLPHAYLAVDFFFALSGFVIAYAYDKSLKTDLSPFSFMTKRTIRLYPLVLMGAIIGSGYLIIREHLNPTPGISITNIVEAVVLAPLLLPMVYPNIPVWGTYPVNGPSWSLFEEFVINAVYGVVVRRISTKGKLLIAATGLLVMLLLAPRLNGVGGGGQPVAIDTLSGFARVTFSFFIGSALFDLARRGKNVLPPVSPIIFSAVLVIVFSIPLGWSINWLIDIVFVIVISPVIILSSIKYTTHGNLSRICNFSGAISYPLYILHKPTYLMFTAILKATHLYDKIPVYALMVICTMICIGCAFFMLKLYDEPVRKLLSTRFASPRAEVTARPVSI